MASWIWWLMSCRLHWQSTNALELEPRQPASMAANYRGRIPGRQVSARMTLKQLHPLQALNKAAAGILAGTAAFIAPAQPEKFVLQSSCSRRYFPFNPTSVKQTTLACFRL
jgi:hypothetical protein